MRIFRCDRTNHKREHISLAIHSALVVLSVIYSEGSYLTCQASADAEHTNSEQSNAPNKPIGFNVGDLKLNGTKKMQPIYDGANAVNLTSEEQKIARELGYDEQVLKLLKAQLQADFFIQQPEGLDAERGYGIPYHMPNLLPEDRENYLEIAEKYPELAPTVKEALDRYNPSENAIKDLNEELMIKNLGKEKTARYKSIEAAATTYRAVLRQERLEQEKNKSASYRDYSIVPPKAVDDDTAMQAYIEELKTHFSKIKLKKEYDLKPILGLKYWGSGAMQGSPDERVALCRLELNKLGYRLMEEPRGEQIPKTFSRKEDAEKFLKESGTARDSLSLNEIKAIKYQAIYPVEQNDLQNPNDAKIITMQSMPDLAMADPSILDKLVALQKLSGDLSLRSAVTNADKPRGVLLSGLSSGELRLDPGAKISKTGDRRWSIDRPARYEATSQKCLASVVKAAINDSGLDLLRLKETSGANYSVTNQMVLDKVDSWNRKFGAVVLEAATDSAKIQFKNLPDDVSELCTEIFLFSPGVVDLSDDEVMNAAKMRDFAYKLQKTKQVQLWWD